MRSRIVASGLVALALGCSSREQGEEESRWVELARSYRSRPVRELAERLEARVDPPRDGRLLEGEDGMLRFELALPRELWSEGERPGDWIVTPPDGGALFLAEPRSLQLFRGAETWVAGNRGNFRTRKPERAPEVDQSAGRFLFEGKGLLLRTGDPQNAPEGISFRVDLKNGHVENERWRTSQLSLVCNGLLAFPGEAETIEVDVPADSVLRLATVSPDSNGRGKDLPPTTFRVLLDGETLLEHEQPYGPPQWHALALDVAGRHTFAFEVRGEAPALFAAPVLGPAELGNPGARPWEDERPDVVILLCDTFRADNLAAWGGDPALAPNLNRLVERSLHFPGARSTAIWTLPSIGTLMTGQFPGQHGGVDSDRAIAGSVETQAEVFAAAGYRTAAVTDSGFFSRQFAQDQGFEWFEEHPPSRWNLEQTLASTRRLMAADDGRPLFLVVHTYRVHSPLRAGPDEDAAPWRETLAEFKATTKGFLHSPEFYDATRRFYHDAVRDLDAKAGTWLDELERDRFFERGVLLLTSDHGNAFGEHDEVGHKGTLFDVKLRVPLAIAGRGVTPRAVPGVVSLVDVAPTLADLAGVEPSPSWAGRSLLELDPDRPTFAFDLKRLHTEIAIFAEGRKVLAPDVQALRDGEPTHAFDLGVDPDELNNLAPDMEWPATLGKALADSLEPWLVPAADAGTLELSEEMKEQLKAIGYGE